MYLHRRYISQHGTYNMTSIMGMGILFSTYISAGFAHKHSTGNYFLCIGVKSGNKIVGAALDDTDYNLLRCLILLPVL
jgi:hypothetical protein